MRIFVILGIVFSAIGAVGLLVALLLFLILPDKVFVLIPLIIGLVDGGTGLGLLGYAQRHEEMKLTLLQSGRRIETKVQAVKLNQYRRINNRNPYNIFTVWQDPATGKNYSFKSEDIWYDPSPYLSENNPTFPVFLDPQNPKRYYVDLSSLPKFDAATGKIIVADKN